MTTMHEFKLDQYTDISPNFQFTLFIYRYIKPHTMLYNPRSTYIIHGYNNGLAKVQKTSLQTYGSVQGYTYNTACIQDWI